ncbi:hypothetical protein SAMN02745196_01058 [Clostridium collagenovorans DSM 3089]|uniref:DUF2178 domain-containing protein n=1 Tax=Clostridium collagenovorans DSM 3089 TaxID=1121306 RepID=A0A1M5V216_9CLOT|nr:hypothetical protein [Clostridium collagenovorans]SHH69259.1 hypothetical protein SAMN02745196_01058 [Clostridium collagenovorans DSM 3089]
MPNKKNTSIIILLGVALSIIGLLLTIFVNAGDVFSRLSTLIFALGFGLIGGGLGNLYKIRNIEKIPGKSKQMEIDYKDERNELIRNIAKSKAGDITNWFVILIAYICIIMGYPLWLIFFVLGVFLLKYIIEIMLIIKYNKEF